MDYCCFCGGRLDPCNESEIVCPWCGEADCWPRLDWDTELEFDLDADFEDSS
jgi:hypothetical protein